MQENRRVILTSVHSVNSYLKSQASSSSSCVGEELEELEADREQNWVVVGDEASSRCGSKMLTA